MSRRQRDRSNSVPEAFWPGAGDEARFRRALVGWFRRNQRQLPWRENLDPYRVWVSEIMLQQTQVTTVVDYFNRFVRRFPTVQKLAAADVDAVLQIWEGLGYYRRARQLHAAARIVVDQFQGRIPRDPQALRQLPGIGRYTAGAILSIAFDLPVPILEGNTIRVFARLLGWREDVRMSTSLERLWRFSESLLPGNAGSGQLNQALMELGSEICRVKSPLCLQCPVRKFCQSATEGSQHEIPIQSPKMTYQAKRDAVVVVEKMGRFLLRKCRPGERWQGLWDFPRFDVSETVTSPTPPKAKPRRIPKANEISDTNLTNLLAKKFRSQYGVGIKLRATNKTIRHAVTKYRIVLSCYRGELEKDPRIRRAEMGWFSLASLGSLALNSTGRKIVNWIRAEEI